MIQRKQTLFLLIVALNAIVVFILPFQDVTTSELTIPLNILPWQKDVNLNSYIYIPFILNCLISLISLFTIFKFKNRVLQYKLANACMLLNVFLMGSYFLFNYLIISPDQKINYHLTAFYPVFGIIFAYLAALFIKKDEQLVRSADRIR